MLITAKLCSTAAKCPLGTEFRAIFSVYYAVIGSKLDFKIIYASRTEGSEQNPTISVSLLLVEILEMRNESSRKYRYRDGSLGGQIFHEQSSESLELIKNSHAANRRDYNIIESSRHPRIPPSCLSRRRVFVSRYVQTVNSISSALPGDSEFLD
jgi:hypothetical protein